MSLTLNYWENVSELDGFPCTKFNFVWIVVSQLI